MALLRAHTGNLLAEGTPTEMVLLADMLGRDEVMFDDVTPGFNPDSVLTAHAENVRWMRNGHDPVRPRVERELLPDARDLLAKAKAYA